MEAYGGIGYTATDVDAWAGTTALDWDETMSEGYVQVFPGLTAGGFDVGLEAGDQYLLYYAVSSPIVSRLHYDSDATRLFAVGRRPIAERAFVEVAAGIYFFDGFVDPGLAGGVGYSFPIGTSFTLPLKLRAGMVLDSDASMFPIGAAAGIAYAF